MDILRGCYCYYNKKTDGYAIKHTSATNKPSLKRPLILDMAGMNCHHQESFRIRVRLARRGRTQNKGDFCCGKKDLVISYWNVNGNLFVSNLAAVGDPRMRQLDAQSALVGEL
eukprot:scaffold55459_cov55-Attheya_sp.AAC.7